MNINKVLSIVYIILIYFLIYFLQVNFFSWFNIMGVSPNLLVLLILFTGIFANGKTGMILGFCLGLYTDFCFSQNIGVTAVLFSIVGFVGEFLEKRFSKDNKITMVVVASIATAIYELVFNICRMVIFSADVNLGLFIINLAIEVLYGALLIIIFYPLIHKFGTYVERIFKNRIGLPKYF